MNDRSTNKGRDNIHRCYAEKKLNSFALFCTEMGKESSRKSFVYCEERIEKNEKTSTTEKRDR